MPFPMLGPHPRVRLNGVAWPLPKICFGRGTQCVNLPKSGIKKLHDLAAGGGGKRAFSEISGRGNPCCDPMPGPHPRVRLNGVARPPPKNSFRERCVMTKPAHTQQCLGAFRLELGATSPPVR